MRTPAKKQKTLATASCIFASLSLILCALAVAVVWFYLKYVPLLLIALITFLPGMINLLLMIPNGKKHVKPPKKSKTPKQKISFKEFIGKLFKALIALPAKIIRFISRNRTNVMFLLLTAALVSVNLFFWIKIRTAAEHSLGFFVPVLLAGVFVVFVVIEKWTNQQSKSLQNSREGIILRNVHSFVVLCQLVTVICAIAATVCVLGFFDLQKLVVILLALAFVYENIFILISLAVHIIRKEIYSNPEVPLPLFGAGGDLSIIEYLEKNTGITMRSLWSIRLIKTIIPYSVAGCAIVLWLSTGIVQVETYQQGALYRMGKLKEDSLQPGIHITLPWPLDKTEIYDTETVKELTIGYLATDATDNLWTEAHGNNEYKLLLGGGNELVSINLRIEHKISDLKKYLSCSTAPEKLLESAAYETVTNHTINTDLDTLLASDRTAFSKSFEKQLRERIAKYDTGIEIVDVVIESIHPPVEVASIYQRIISAGIEAEKIILDAKALAGTTIAEANAQYDSDVNSATAENHEKIAQAESSVAEFMASVNANKEYGDGYRYYKYLDALKTAYTDAKLIIIGDGINSNNIYLGSVS